MDFLIKKTCIEENMPQNLMQGAVIHKVHALKWERGIQKKKRSRIF